MGRRRKVFATRTKSGRPSEAGQPVDGARRIRNARILAEVDGGTPCAIYVICPNLVLQPSKIGISAEPDERLSTLQISHWMRLIIYQTIWLPSKMVAYEIEQEAHRRLLGAGLGMSGEWFNIGGKRAETEILGIMDLLDLTPLTNQKKFGLIA